MKSKPKVVSIVLTWNSAGFIEECLDSLQKSSYKTDILVIDNDSGDKTRELIAEKFPTIELINSGANLGYAGGNNFGIKHALKKNPEYIFILNPDATIEPRCIELMVARMEQDSSLAVTSPLIYDGKGTKIWYAGSNINWKTGETPQTGAGQQDTGQFNHELFTGRANGCAMLVSCQAIEKVGLMDEQYFLYYEEVDWSVRFQKADYTIGLVPQAKVWHTASSSTGGHLSPLYQYYMTRNKLLFIKKQRPSMLVLVLIFSMYTNLINVLVCLKRSSILKTFNVIRVIIMAQIDFFVGRFGQQRF